MDPIKTNAETTSARFERILARAQFEALRPLLERLSAGREKLLKSVLESNTYGELLSGLGFQLTIVRQIHVQDCYDRLGAAGGIKAVLPYYDIPTQSSVPTLVNFDGTVTATPKSVAFFEALFRELKQQLQTQP